MPRPPIPEFSATSPADPAASGGSAAAIDSPHALQRWFGAPRRGPYWLSYKRGPLCTPARDAIVAATEQAFEQGAGALHHWYPQYESARQGIAELLDAPGGAREIAFCKNAADAISIVANGLDWRDGDEVLITDREYPANVYPWWLLKRRGVTTRMVRHRDERFTVRDFVDALTPKTRLIATSTVYFSSGFRLDAAALGVECQRRGVRLLLDAVQSVGVEPVSARELGADFVVGDARKFLCATDGAAFLWGRWAELERLSLSQAGAHSVEHVNEFLRYEMAWRNDARRFEPGARSTLPLVALNASLGVWRRVGMANVKRWAAECVQMLVAVAPRLGLGVAPFAATPAEQSAILVVRGEPADNAKRLAAAAAIGAQIGARSDRELVLAAHGFVTPDDVERTLRALQV